MPVSLPLGQNSRDKTKKERRATAEAAHATETQEGPEKGRKQGTPHAHTPRDKGEEDETPRGENGRDWPYDRKARP